MTHQLKSIAPQLLIRKSGFTLVEILIVIAIIGLLAVIAIPRFISYRSQAVDAQLKSDLRNSAVAVEGYFTKKYGLSIEHRRNRRIWFSTDRRGNFNAYCCNAEYLYDHRRQTGRHATELYVRQRDGVDQLNLSRLR